MVHHSKFRKNHFIFRRGVIYHVPNNLRMVLFIRNGINSAPTYLRMFCLLGTE